MSRFLPLFLTLVALTQPCSAQTAPTPDASGTNSVQAASLLHLTPTASNATLQGAIEQLTQNNRELLDLLKQQQSVLEDIQFDRRKQSREIESLEERLEEALLQNSRLQNKVDNLEAAPANVPPATQFQATNQTAANNSAPVVTNAPPPPPVVDTPPPPPATYLPPPDSEGEPGTKSWHRLFTLSGTDGQKTDLFQIQGPQWRVVWHNQDKDGKVYKNTSALFIHAYPKDDTIPQEICAKLGSGGDKTELTGAGTYYLKIEASGGAWELAVEDFR